MLGACCRGSLAMHATAPGPTCSRCVYSSLSAASRLSVCASAVGCPHPLACVFFSRFCVSSCPRLCRSVLFPARLLFSATHASRYSIVVVSLLLLSPLLFLVLFLLGAWLASGVLACSCRGVSSLSSPNDSKNMACVILRCRRPDGLLLWAVGVCFACTADPPCSCEGEPPAPRGDATDCRPVAFGLLPVSVFGLLPVSVFVGLGGVESRVNRLDHVFVSACGSEQAGPNTGRLSCSRDTHGRARQGVSLAPSV